MWDKLVKQVAVEREQLVRLIADHKPLIEKCSTTEPDPIELSALGAMLHSFYTGIENVFKRIEVEHAIVLPQGEHWHVELLNSMARWNQSRREVITEPLQDILKEHLQFRHVFRQGYTFQLRWQKMAPLVLKSEDTLKQLERSLDAFTAAGPLNGPASQG